MTIREARVHRLILAGLLAVIFTGTATRALAAAPACRPDPRIDQVAADWMARKPQPLRYIEPGQGGCFRQQLIARLQRRLGPVAGYKLGAFTKAGQAVYSTDRPVVAPLLRDMLLPEGRPVPADYGATPLWEADFLLVVKDAGINTARTREEAYRHLRGYRPFIELPDRGYAADAKLTLDQWKALGMSTRAGLAAKEVPLPRTAEGPTKLAAMTVEAESVGPNGRQTRHAVVRETFGDPLDAVLAARDLLREEGLRLKAGDVISIGSVLPALPVRAGETVTVRYRILDKVDTVSATFR